jgi:hypothetical protein
VSIDFPGMPDLPNSHPRQTIHSIAYSQAHCLVLVAGALLAPGRRTVTATLRIMGLDQAPVFAVYHRVY